MGANKAVVQNWGTCCLKDNQNNTFIPESGTFVNSLSVVVFYYLEITFPNACACCRDMLNSLGCTGKSMIIEELVSLVL